MAPAPGRVPNRAMSRTRAIPSLAGLPVVSAVPRPAREESLSQKDRSSPLGVRECLRAELVSSRSALEVRRVLEAACCRSRAVAGVQVVENLYNYLGIVSFKPGRIDPALVAALGATSYGIDCAMLIVPNRRVPE